jgi:glycosyl transferase family 25
MKAYIINLERSARRRTNVLGEMRRHAIDHEIVPAIDGREMSVEDLERLPIADSVRRNPAYYTPNVIAAALSHARVYERIVEDGHAAALVLEDDVKLCDGFGEVLAGIERVIRPNEIIVCHFMSFRPMELLGAESETVGRGYSVHGCVSLNDVNSGAGYVITREAAKTMLKAVTPLSTQADDWEAFQKLGGFDSIRFVYPTPVTVRGDKSTIATDYQSDVRKWLTSAFDDYRVPPFHQILRAARLRSIASRSRVVIVDSNGNV